MDEPAIPDGDDPPAPRPPVTAAPPPPPGPVLVLGGTGAFGSRLARGLRRDGVPEVIVAGRDLAAAESLAREIGGRAARLDRDAPDLAVRVAALRPWLVIDAAGPFQGYAAGGDPYRVARAAVACGAHALDLSDDAAFTAGIGALDAEARAAGVAVLSGASSVPALSSAAARALARGLADVHLVEAAILPGNRAPRGLSVMRAILAQAGRPVRVRRGRRWTTVPGWGRSRREALEVPGAAPLLRRSSPIGAPDLLLVPAWLGARSVGFRAGLELGVMHQGLAALAWLARLRLVRSLEPLARPLRRVAALLGPFGTDRGGMVVRVIGTRADGAALRRSWTLVAEAGDGPQVPALPARILCARLRAGLVARGARPCLGEITLEEAETHDPALRLRFGRAEAPDPPLFQRVLGPAGWAALPPEIRDLHTVLDVRRWEGRATVTRGRSPLARVVAAGMGFPPEGEDVPVRVTMTREGDGETWVRDFAGRRFRSRLTARPGGLGERFGPVAALIPLAVEAGRLRYPVARATWLGLPLPRVLLPQSDTREEGADGRALFDVRIALPLAGAVVRYRGWLREAPPDPP